METHRRDPAVAPAGVTEAAPGGGPGAPPAGRRAGPTDSGGGEPPRERRRSWVGPVIGPQGGGAEAELARTLSLLRSTLEATADGILIVDTTGRMTGWNQRFVRMWGIPDEIIAARDDSRAVAYVLDQLCEPQEFLRKVHELYRRPEAESHDVVRFKDGRVIERVSYPQRLDGRTIGRVWSFRDVTVQKQAEDRLAVLLHRAEESRERAEEAVRARDEFLAIASHELRTPVTSLQIAVQALLRLFRRGGLPDAPPEFLEEALSTSERQVRHLVRLVHDMLEVSREDIAAGAGRPRLTLDEADLVAVAQSAIDGLCEELRGACCPVMLEAPAPVRGRWDAARLERVVANLLRNALRFGAGKPVTVSVSREDPGVPAGPVAVLAVRDQGIGVPSEQQQHIFERFSRAASSLHYGGLGLGLYQVRELVRAHGGEVSVQSSPGQGATFTVRLPLAPPEVEEGGE